jgi:hypothetical protein
VVQWFRIGTSDGLYDLLFRIAETSVSTWTNCMELGPFWEAFAQLFNELPTLHGSRGFVLCGHKKAPKSQILSQMTWTCTIRLYSLSLPIVLHNAPILCLLIRPDCVAHGNLLTKWISIKFSFCIIKWSKLLVTFANVVFVWLLDWLIRKFAD